MTREKKSFQRLNMTGDPLDDGPTTRVWSTHDLPNFYGPHQQTAGAVMSVCYFVWLSSYNDLVQMFQQNVPFRQGRPHEVTNKLLSLCAAVNFVWRSKKTQDCMCTSQTVNNVTIPYWNHMYRNIHTESRKINFFKKKKKAERSIYPWQVYQRMLAQNCIFNSYIYLIMLPPIF